MTDLELPQHVIHLIECLGIEISKEMRECISNMLQYRDVIVEGEMVFEKVLAFLIPVVHILSNRETPLMKHDIGAVILSPTKVYAKKMNEALTIIIESLPSLTCHYCMDHKRSVKDDLYEFHDKGANIIICAPPRLKELLKKTSKLARQFLASLQDCEILIVDGADRILECHGIKYFKEILPYIPNITLSGIFTSEINSSIDLLSRMISKTPHVIKDGTNLLNANICYNYIIVEPRNKFGLLVSLLLKASALKIIVIFSSNICVDYHYALIRGLVDEKKFTVLRAVVLNTGKASKRYNMFCVFKRMRNGVLLCTQEAFHGVEITQMDMIIQYEPPASSSGFIHLLKRVVHNTERRVDVHFLLFPSQLDYVSYINEKHQIDLQPVQLPFDIPNLFYQMREFQINERENFDKANNAFLYQVEHFYPNHECSNIMNVQNINLADLAYSYGLLRIPEFPGISEYDVSDFIPCDLETNLITYRKASLEKRRQLCFEIKKNTGKDVTIADLISEETIERKRKCKENSGWRKGKLRAITREIYEGLMPQKCGEISPDIITSDANEQLSCETGTDILVDVSTNMQSEADTETLPSASSVES